ncbi:MAG: 16S rRNA (uracil(1498)-N(3))-methyltransferase [SAR86 cluster bacterium]|uniref:Ribosomal RNA small subunit methyltransferase E n=1 Tax=SAR86 cluster bacterium TaxID=2030880 RepID=A0A2A4MTG9_9GAMM|nr:MAG: 16S rRNA (uracil(1498)-N(3))-methyltransferase [SAR86 cluster bacterium]
MRISRLYTTLKLLANGTLTLEGDTAHYLSKVLRLRVGHSFHLFNERDGEFFSTIVNIERRSISVQLGDLHRQKDSASLCLNLALGLSRSDRFDYAIQKATELGVSTISPLISEHCDVKLKADRIENKVNHWHKIAIAASEQCGRISLPIIQSPQPLTNWLDLDHDGLRLILDHRGDAMGDVQQRDIKAISMLIGPEGGFSEEEISLALARDFRQVSLGPRILRTETAPVVSLSVLQFLFGDLN